MTRDEIVLRLEQEYSDRRTENARLFEEKTEQACERCPGLREKITQRHMLVMDRIREGLTGKLSMDMKKEMERLNAEIAECLRRGELPADFLKPVYTCEICRDEGYVYTPNRGMCECMRKELNRRLLAENGLTESGPSFENWDETVYGAEGNPSPRKAAVLNKTIALRYADSFPDTHVQNLLISGMSGLGKTYLLWCIVRRISERGFLPIYISAYRLLEKARQAYMEGNDAALAPYFETELLVIDDLGTEPLMNNITVTQFFNLLNERMTAGRHTVISTNLTVKELQERYTERIASRLMDSRCCAHLPFTGEDIRTKGRVTK